MSDKKESMCASQGRTEDRCQRGGDYKGGSRRDYVPRPYKQQYCPREKRAEQRRSKESTAKGEGVVVPSLDGNPVSSRKAKKHSGTSLNHLLNFTLTPREPNTTWTSVPSMTRRKTHVQQCYNKEQYLQANCQFVVSASGDYSGCYGNADLLVDWDKIEQVRLLCHQIPSCPICLYLPRAAQITRCGHVYCLSCLLHYLELSEKKWRRCPICYESIYKKDLKSVVALENHQFKVGDVLRMKLMKRKKGTNCALPKSRWPQEVPGVLHSQDAVDSHFLKLLPATPSQVLIEIIQPGRLELEAVLCNLKSDEASEKPFVEKALEELKAREEAALYAVCRLKMAESSQPDGCNGSPHTEVLPPRIDKFEKPFSSSEDEETDSLSTSPDSPVQSGGQNGEINLFKSQLSTDEPTEIVCSNLENLSSQVQCAEIAKSSALAGDFVFFYQACDGQHLYLHPVNAKCLIKQYGSLENGPEEIEAQLVQIDQMSMTEEFCRRFRYLNHLPITCEFALCELALEPPTVSKATLEYYRDELEKRCLNRKKKKEEEIKMHSASSPGSWGISDDEFFPQGPALRLSLDETVPQLLVPTVQEETLADEQKGAPEVPSAPSFAEALRCSSGKPPPPAWPVKHKAKAVTNASMGRRTSLEDQENGDEASSVPSYQASFNSSLVVSPEATAGGGEDDKSSTKKKGRKKLVLFTTGGTRGN